MLDYAARKLNLTTGAVRIGHIASTKHNPRGWNRNEWLPGLVLSSRSICALPDALGPKGLNSSGVMSSINWLPINQLAEILIELAFSLPQGSRNLGVQFHAVNPHPVTWESLLPTAQKTLEETLLLEGATSARPVELIPLPTWIDRLQSSASAVTASKTSKESSDILYQNPGIKLLDFYKSLAMDESAPRCTFAIEKTSEASQSLRKLEAICKEWMAGWIKDWVASLK